MLIGLKSRSFESGFISDIINLKISDVFFGSMLPVRSLSTRHCVRIFSLLCTSTFYVQLDFYRKQGLSSTSSRTIEFGNSRWPRCWYFCQRPNGAPFPQRSRTELYCYSGQVRNVLQNELLRIGFCL